MSCTTAISVGHEIMHDRMTRFFVKKVKFDEIIKSLDLNRHLWSHAWTKYESLPARKQSGRFKQLMKFVSKQYKGNLLLSERKMSESQK